MNGGTGDDTLRGGEGKDVFLYGSNGENDLIIDYNSADDKIQLTDEEVYLNSAEANGNNVVLNVGMDGSITVQNGRKQKINVTDSSGKVTSLIYGSEGNDSLVGGKGTDLLLGDKGSDTLKGGDGADTLQGGKGNDSLWGNAGADTFIYYDGDGQDIIYGFDKNDVLQIMDVAAKDITGTVNTKGTEIYFKVGSTANAITLKDFGNTSTFNVNGTKYKLSGNTLTK